MILLSILKTAYLRVHAFSTERTAYRELSKLPPHLLDDVGLGLRNGKVIKLKKSPSKAVDAVPDLRLVIDQAQTAKECAEVQLPPETQGG